MSTESTALTQRRPLRFKGLHFFLMLFMGAGLLALAFFSEAWMPKNRMEWWHFGYFFYQSAWSALASKILWLAVIGLCVELISRLHRTRVFAGRVTDRFLAKFPLDPVFVDMCHQRWDTKWFFKVFGWATPQRISLLIRGFFAFIIVNVAYCDIMENSIYYHLYYLAWNYPLWPFKEWYTAINEYSCRGILTWQIFIVPTLVLGGIAWAVSLKRHHNKLSKQQGISEG